MNKTLTGLAALLGAASISANANAGNFCLNEEQCDEFNEEAMYQMESSGAVECDSSESYCYVRESTINEIERYNEGVHHHGSLNLDVHVMDEGNAEGTNARAFTSNTIVFNKDFIEALHYAARGYVYKLSNPDFDITGYFRSIASAANYDSDIEEPWDYAMSDVRALDYGLASKYERSLVAMALAHEAAHVKYEDNEEQICATYANYGFFPADEVAGMLVNSSLSRSAEERADRFGAKFLVSTCTSETNEEGAVALSNCTYEPDSALVLFKFIDAVESEIGRDLSPFATHPPAWDRFDNIKGTLRANNVDISAVWAGFGEEVYY